ncbi:Arv1 protein [Zopfochytrium polystomum]|nr:Arv1 protein [Zopfochytrium polystomum]
MSVCVTCGEGVPALFLRYTNGSIKLLQCGACNDFADKYIENDGVIVFIDMVLHKRPVYRHLLKNRVRFGTNGLNAGIINLGVLLILFEVYLKWFKLEQYHGRSDFLEVDSVVVQYFYVLAVCTIEAIIWHIAIRLAVYFLYKPRSPDERTKAFFNRVSMALMISSYGKLLLIMMVIWDYDELNYAWLINLFVLTSNLEALSALLNTSYFRILMILGFGLMTRLCANALVRYHNPHMVIFML